ncbi:MAG: hypothetical protein H6815_10335 [Phycisphaeraceae bacterium]|nr:hypothetical protein [Phycisphaerales bacterium]MCB9860837.1 hypothetical protein [Phycisphaeraceae bacterium]
MHTSSFVSMNPRLDRYTTPGSQDLLGAVDPTDSVFLKDIVEFLRQTMGIREFVSWEGRTWGWTLVFARKTGDRPVEWFLVARSPEPMVSVRLNSTAFDPVDWLDIETLLVGSEPESHRLTGRTLWSQWVLDSAHTVDRVCKLARAVQLMC